MEQHHKRRRNKTAPLNIVSLMDIFTILIFFLLVSVADPEILPGTKVIKLSEQTTDKWPKENVIIMVNNHKLLLQDTVIADTREIARSNKPTIANLVSHLKHLNEESLQTKNGQPLSKRGVIIMGDKQLHYHLLRKIMLSCTMASYSNISLAGIQHESAARQNVFDRPSLTNSEPLSNADTARTTSNLKDPQHAAAKTNLNTGNQNSREEEIALVFKRNKSAIFSLYNRALRRDPMLQGKVILELTISASGRITKCRIISSELGNTSLERKLLARIKMFRFAAKPGKTVTLTYPIDFLPS